LVLGRTEGSLLRLEAVWPCLNVWQPSWPALEEAVLVPADPLAPGPSRLNRFAIDPREQLLAQKWARERDLQVIGSAHSHPDGPAIPSAIDRGWVLAPTLMLIRSGERGGEGRYGAWWWPEPPAGPVPLRMVGGGDLGE
jgi:proteasome lid subunit RPN8/RPN11